MTTDIWKPIAGFPGYFVSDLGKVMSCRKRDKSGPGIIHDKPFLLKPDIGKLGHLRVTLSSPKGRLSRIFVHRLVLEAFVGRHPKGRPQVDHIDRNPANNELQNLRWCSCAENNRNKPITGVSVERGRWKARIRIGNGKRIRLGGFATKAEARAAYERARAKYHREFACPAS